MSYTNNLEMFENLETKVFIDTLISDFYPENFKLIEEIESLIRPIQQETEAAIINTIAHKINNEFDELYRKEKWFLFPYLIKLEEGNKFSNSIVPFNYIKSKYNKIILTIGEFKNCLLESEFSYNDIRNAINAKLKNLEYNLQFAQKVKEDFLFSKFYTNINY